MSCPVHLPGGDNPILPRWPGAVFSLRSHKVVVGIVPHLNPADEQLAQKFEAGKEDAEQGGDAEMTDGGADFEPGALVADHPEEVHRQHVAERHDEHEERAGGDAEPARQDAQVGANDGEGDEQLE